MRSLWAWRNEQHSLCYNKTLIQGETAQGWSDRGALRGIEVPRVGRTKAFSQPQREDYSEANRRDSFLPAESRPDSDLIRRP